LQSGKSTLSYVRELYALCEEKLIIEGTREKKCIYYSMKECLGACKDEEVVEAYNERANDAIIFLTKVFDNDFIIVTEGRNIDELGLVLIEDKLYKGYGYISKDEANMGIEEMKEAIESRYSSAEAAMIIIQYLKENKALKIIKI
jgi:DNA polymerase III subunit epsilon